MRNQKFLEIASRAKTCRVVIQTAVDALGAVTAWPWVGLASTTVFNITMRTRTMMRAVSPEVDLGPSVSLRRTACL